MGLRFLHISDCHLETSFGGRPETRERLRGATREAFERALVPWNLLAEREATDIAVQESWLTLPYAYGELGIHGRAADRRSSGIDQCDGSGSGGSGRNRSTVA